MTKLTAYLMTNWLIGMIESNKPPEIPTIERFVTTNEYTKEQVRTILENADFSIARKLLFPDKI